MDLDQPLGIQIYELQIELLEIEPKIWRRVLVSGRADEKKKPARTNALAGFAFRNPGDFLLSHAVSRAVPSAPAGLTSVFGMGTGVTLPTKSPENLIELCTFDLCSLHGP